MISGMVAGQMYSGGALPTTIGEAFGGGYYVGDITVGADVYAVIMAGSGGESPTAIRWKATNDTSAGAISLVDGLGNTNDLLAVTNHTAANYCDTYTDGEFTDWYLASKDELNLAWTNRASLAYLAMSAEFYWSSTQISGQYPSKQSMSDGTQNYNFNKYGTCKVRPARRLLK